MSYFYRGVVMKRSIVATAVAISLGISIGTSTAAFAETAGSTASPKPKAESNQAYKAALEKWKSDSQAAQNAFKTAMADYLAKMKANAAARKSANDAFKSAVDAARNAYKSAMAAATTAEAKTAAENARKAAIAAATAARDLALKAIATLPAKPVKPAEAPKPVQP